MTGERRKYCFDNVPTERSVRFREYNSEVEDVSTDSSELWSPADSSDDEVNQVVIVHSEDSESEAEEYLADFVDNAEEKFLEGLLRALNEEEKPFEEFKVYFRSVPRDTLLQQDLEGQRKLYRLRRFCADVTDVIDDFNEVLISDRPAVEREQRSYYRALNNFSPQEE